MPGSHVGSSTRRCNCCAAVSFQNGLATEVLDAVFPGSVINPTSKDNTTADLNFLPDEKIRDEGISAQIDWTTPP